MQAPTLSEVSYSCQVPLGAGFARTAQVQVEALRSAGLLKQVFSEDMFWDPGQVNMGGLKDTLFDGVVASHLEPCRILHGWSNAMLSSMRSAKLSGAKTIVERQSAHVSVQKTLVGGIDPYAEMRMVKEYAEADAILVPSRFVEQTFIEAQPELKPKLTRIPLGVDLDKFKRISHLKHPLRLLFVASNFDRKGGLALMRAWQIARSQSKNCRAGVLWIAGETPAGNLGAGVNPLGGLAEPEYVRTVVDCDVLVLPSMEDGFGLVVLEAMACLPKGEPVLTQYGPVPIETLREGSRVYSLTGDAEVVATMQRDYDGKLVTILPLGTLPFTVTEDHPVLTYTTKTANKPNWKPASQITAEDFVAIPVENREIEWEIHVPDALPKRRPVIERILSLDEGLAWFLGWYAAEGWSHRSQVGLSLGDRDTPHLRRLKATVRNYFERSPQITRSGSSTVLRFAHAGLAKILPPLMGNSAKTKRIPPEIMWSPQSVTHSFIEGYLLGDGHLDPGRKRWQASTVSKSLALHLQLAFAKLGIFASVYSYATKEHFLRGSKISASIKFVIGVPSYFSTKTQAYRTQVQVNHHEIRIPVRNVSTSDYRGPVYNIGTTDGTFSLPCIVHNCGKPVIISSNVGAQDCMSDGREGYIVAPGNAQELATAIVRLADSTDRRLEMGEQAHRSAAKFSWQKYRERYLELITGML